MKVTVTQTFGVRRNEDGDIEIYQDRYVEGGDITGMCLVKAETLDLAVSDLRAMMESDMLDDYFEVDVMDVHPTNDKHLLS